MMDYEIQEAKGKGLGSWEGQEETQRKRSAEVHDDQSVETGEQDPWAKVEGHTGDKTAQ